MKSIALKIVLSLIILFLGYKVTMSIMEPVQFQNEKESREKVVIELLKEIRDVQIAYKSINNRYTSSFDTLIDFVKNGEIPVVNIIPDPTDTTFTKTINDTIAYINVADSLFKNHVNFNADAIRYIPFSNGVEFTIDADVIERSKVKINVFEVSALYKDFLVGLDEQLIRNLLKKREELEKFEGLRVGSMTEASTDGNWEF
ncbi:MAG: hypothetical protein CL663_01605 [Bacteroidetes bacterium]|nr:hypothetical protein [Bacteroidota bacterium]|tara:strand:+ start:63 stop:665 length:603 start_codon:yes stop_codon:yes gene_type:complete